MTRRSTWFSASVPSTVAQGRAPGRVPSARAAEEPVGAVECECGRRARTRRGCLECRRLDGDGRLEPFVVAAMRQVGGPMTVSDLVEMLHVARETVQRALKRMVASGRARRYWTERPRTATSHLGTSRGATSTASDGSWAYQLCG